MRFLAGGVLLATIALLAPAWSLGPSWFVLLLDHRRLALEAWAGWVLALSWLLRSLWAVVFLRASGGRLQAASRS